MRQNNAPQSWQSSINTDCVDIPYHLAVAMDTPRQGALQQGNDIVTCNGITWHTDTWLDSCYTALLIIKNDGFQLETHSRQFKCNPSEIIVFDHQKRHRLKATKPFVKGMFWGAFALELDDWDGDRISLETAFKEISIGY